VTQRMVNMAGERLTRLATPRGFVILRADHLEFRPAAPTPRRPPTRRRSPRWPAPSGAEPSSRAARGRRGPTRRR
jgi:hypothetical protein